MIKLFKKFAVTAVILFFLVGIVLEIAEATKLAITTVSAGVQAHYYQEKQDVQ